MEACKVETTNEDFKSSFKLFCLQLKPAHQTEKQQIKLQGYTKYNTL